MHNQYRIKPFRARMASTFVALILGTTCIAGNLACDSRENEDVLEEERTNFLIWTAVLNSSLTDFATACNTAVTAGQSCATNAGGSALYTSSYLQSNFSISTSTDAASICTTYPEAGILAAYSAAAKVCWFNCETTYWNTGLTGTSCTGANFTTYAANAFADIQTCANTCRASGTFFIY